MDEGSMSAVAWLMIAGGSAAGAWTYLAIRPYDGHWLRLAGMFVASMSIGMVTAPGLCEWYGIASIYKHVLVAFFASLLGMPLCRAAVATTESESAGWIKRLVLRVTAAVIGGNGSGGAEKADDSDDRPQPRRATGNDREDGKP